jgi:divalent metal cation (Fe/Co/Zn/Cd) transporter
VEQVLANPSKQQVSTVRMLQLFTIGWMCVEIGISLFAGIRACSVALTAFGADSGIELVSAVVVLRRFTSGPISEQRAARISGILLYVLAAYILVTSTLIFMSTRLQPEPTVLGIGLLIAAAIIMPLLGRAKKKLAAETGSRALGADAAQSNICTYMSWIALAGLLVNLFFHLAWADSVAALLLIPIVLKEAREASKGEVCQC